MKSLNYFFEDIKNILKRPGSLVTIIALIILPGFYSWFNIIASWDPYGNTGQIQIAVSNNDIGDGIGDTNINIGNSLIENLQKNHNLGWQFVDQKTAEEGVLEGRYYASIIIPENFSKNLLSFLSENPQKPVLQYTVNEKINAIAPKITGKGVETLREAIEANFISTLNENLFEKTNLAGQKIAQHKQDIQKSQSLINDISQKLPELQTAIQNGGQSIQKGIHITEILQNGTKELDAILNEIQVKTQEIPGIEDAINNAGKSIQMQIIPIISALQESQLKAENIKQNINQSHNTFKPILDSTHSKLLIFERILGKFEKTLTGIQKITKIHIFDGIIQKIQNTKNKIQQYIQINRKIAQMLDRGENISQEILDKYTSINQTLILGLSELNTSIEHNLPKKSQQIAGVLKNIFADISMHAKEMQNHIPEAQSHLDGIQNKLKKGDHSIELILKNWGKLENTIKKIQFISHKINDGRIDALLRLLLLDPENEKNFFKNPVEIDTKSLFSSPNYGSAIAPFFTVLALWTGALLCSSMLSVRSQKAYQENNIRSGYLGRLILFLVIGYMQAGIVVCGNIFLLHTYVANPWGLLFGSILIVSVFHVLVYSLVFLFGKVGNVLAIIFLLLQLSAGSGTFPVELTNDIFVKIHPYIPFTYAINLLRETNLGIVESIFWYNIIVLIGMFIGFLLIAYILAPKLSPFAIKTNKRTEGMDIFN